ncbi:hypothetical protein HMPREF9473_02136, partial [, partial [Hungatella hathewayi WAL-18680]
RCNQRFFLINKNDFSSKYCEDCKTEIQAGAGSNKKAEKARRKTKSGPGGTGTFRYGPLKARKIKGFCHFPKTSSKTG